MKGYLSIVEAAEYTGVSAAMVRKQIALGVWPHVRVGRRILVPLQQLDKLLST